MKINMLLYSLITILIFGCSPEAAQDSISVNPYSGYPLWLSVEGSYTSQTSGITFIKKDEEGKRHFLLADDVGALHHLTMASDTIQKLKKISFSQEVLQLVSKFPKRDFEEISYDRSSGKILLSIEGNEPEVKSIVGIYELKFYNDDFLSDSVISISKLNIQPEEKLLQYTEDNIGFEGVAADENYYYIALEGFSESGLFADSTIMYIVDKKGLKIRNILNSKKFGIATICGLYSDRNYSVYGVDRNSKKIFHLKFNDNLEVSSYSITGIPTWIPSYNNFDYVVSFESITMDEEKAVYLVDDPWRKHYIPSKEILVQLDEPTVEKFKLYIPALYKFTLKH